MAQQRYYQFTTIGTLSGQPETTFHKAHSPAIILAQSGVKMAEGERAKPGKVYATEHGDTVSYKKITAEEYARATAAANSILTALATAAPVAEPFIESIAPLIQPDDLPQVFAFLGAADACAKTGNAIKPARPAYTVPPPSRRHRSHSMFGVYALA
ncbi:MAG: hypothetical protein AB7U82_27935 [Blastocatellales bacterium]